MNNTTTNTMNDIIYYNCKYDVGTNRGLFTIMLGFFCYNIVLFVFTNDNTKNKQIDYFGKLYGTCIMLLGLSNVVEYCGVLNYLKINIYDCHYVSILFFGFNMFVTGLFLGNPLLNLLTNNKID